MIKSLFGATALALVLAAAPASAQLLGGSGGLGGTLGGGLGGTNGAGAGSLGGMIDRAPLRDDTLARTTGSARADKHVDTRKGHASASGSVAGDGALDSSTAIGRRTLGASGSGSASGSGNADVQLVGTDAVRGATGRASGIARSGVATTRDAAGNAVTRADNAVARGYNAAGSTGASTAGSGSGMASGGLGQLALSGSAAANGAGSFGVAPGMAVTDARGRVIGTVQSLRTTARGTVEQVVMKVGKRSATLPAANFSGSGNVLVSAMGKGEVSDAAK